jgi:hypothetical protein
MQLNPDFLAGYLESFVTRMLHMYLGRLDYIFALNVIVIDQGSNTLQFLVIYHAMLLFKAFCELCIILGHTKRNIDAYK